MSRPTGHQPGLTSASDAVNQTNILVYATWALLSNPLRSRPASSPLALNAEAGPEISKDDDTDSVLTALSELSLLTSVSSQKSSPSKSRKRKAGRSPDTHDGRSDADTSEDETQEPARKRVFRGKIRYNVPILPMSKGPIDPNAIPWPKRAPNTVAGRMVQFANIVHSIKRVC